MKNMFGEFLREDSGLLRMRYDFILIVIKQGSVLDVGSFDLQGG